jgi:hypothetical protein
VKADDRLYVDAASRKFEYALAAKTEADRGFCGAAT